MALSQNSTAKAHASISTPRSPRCSTVLPGWRRLCATQWNLSPIRQRSAVSVSRTTKTSPNSTLGPRAIAASFGVRAEHTWVGAKCPPAVALRGWERARSTATPVSFPRQTDPLPMADPVDTVPITGQAPCAHDALVGAVSKPPRRPHPSNSPADAALGRKEGHSLTHLGRSRALHRQPRVRAPSWARFFSSRCANASGRG